MDYNWVSLLGKFQQENGEITFKGGRDKDPFSDKEYPAIGNYLCDRFFGGGVIESTINFPTIATDVTACGIMFCYDTEQRYFVVASVNLRKDVVGAFYLRHFESGKWIEHDFSGDRTTIKEKEDYNLKITVEGSKVEFFINNVSVIKKNLLFPLPRRQVGIWCHSSEDILIKNFNIKECQSSAFVIMQFTDPFNELFQDVIQPCCTGKNILAIRADEKYGPGHILTDIKSEINSAKFIIAEITPVNQNVFFEVGYAHAIRKPIIFIAEKGKELPFDVSGFRVLFYENSIRGKKDIEEGLKRNIDAVLAGD